VVVPGAGHALPMHDPDRLAERAVAFAAGADATT
jgi:hypothetical protein